MSSIGMIIGILMTLVFVVLAMRENKKDVVVQERIAHISYTQTAAPQKLIRHKEMEKSFTERVVLPFLQGLSDKVQEIIPLSNKSWVNTKLIQAGYQKPHYQRTFLGVQVLTAAVLFGLMFTITSISGSKFGPLGFVISGFFGLIGYLLPMGWLYQQAAKRQDSIQKSLADFLDLLVICVEAGLALDSAIHKVADMRSVRISPYLREELQTYCKDVNFGKPRKQALMALSDRTGMEDLNAIVNAIIQAYEMGSGITHTLRVQADSLRVKRLAKAEEKANKIPVKMVPPIYVFLFPAIFVTIFVPIGMVMVDAVMKILGGGAASLR